MKKQCVHNIIELQAMKNVKNVCLVTCLNLIYYRTASNERRTCTYINVCINQVCYIHNMVFIPTLENA
jgi:hypothetical protein